MAKTARALCALMGALAAISGSAQAASSLSWEGAFSTDRTPPQLYYKAIYWDGKAGPHEMESWRKGNDRLRRYTDHRLDLHVERGDDGEYRYRLADLERKIVVNVERRNLYRIGVFSDWDGLAHVLTRPKGDYSIVKIAHGASKPGHTPCTWFRLEKKGETGSSEICWSDRLAIPLRIDRIGEDGRRSPSWRVVRASRRDIPAPTFQLAQTGLFQVDANTDIDPRGD